MWRVLPRLWSQAPSGIQDLLIIGLYTKLLTVTDSQLSSIQPASPEDEELGVLEDMFVHSKHKEFKTVAILINANSCEPIQPIRENIEKRLSKLHERGILAMHIHPCAPAFICTCERQ